MGQRSQPAPQSHDDPPIHVLMAEHVLILQALDALERKVAALPGAADPDPAYFEKAVEFFRTYADKCHHGKEEDILFTAMVEEADFSRESGPIAVLTSDHVKGRALVRALAEGAARVPTDPSAARQIIESAQEYIAHLRAHIAREDDKVFPLAEQFLSEECMHAMSTAFDRFEREQMGAGTHDRMRALLGELQADA